ncbi:hypothetical protein V5O48_002911 [Marasmius crinis-equi]|uniref:Uncharacterized protein n=1 Tax=Marasmius crinis-equi TaxID=585013 RepID=A0ABR3FUC8_9AGAR
MDCPPSYTPSPSSPCYSEIPISGETTLATSRSLNTTPTGTYERRFGTSRVILTGQQAGAPTPSYGRNGVVNGAVEFEDVQTIQRVRLKLIGKLKSSVSGPKPCATSTKIMHQAKLIWTRASSLEAKEGSLSIPFATSFPTTFKDGLQCRPLPPTISIPINYVPRKRPPQPVLRGYNFSSTVKCHPEEWLQTNTVLKPRCWNGTGPIHAHFFVPAVKIFGFADTIPIHVRLTGPVSSLQKLFKLLRQVSVDFEGLAVWVDYNIGETTVRRIPPAFETFTPQSSSASACEEIEELEWEGELRCNGDVRVGQFDAGNISIRDFIIFSFDSPSQGNLSFSSVPIALVTDTWSEEP